MKNILVASIDSAFLDRAELFDDERFNLVAALGDGGECLEYIERGDIEIVVMDLALPTVDGYGIMDRINAMETRPEVYIMSNIAHSSAVDKAMGMGAKYYFVKPVSVEEVKKVVAQITETPGYRKDRREDMDSPMRDRKVEEEISRIFINLGIPAHIKGYQFLRTAITRVIMCPPLINSITKQLYPLVAAEHNTTASKVERAIRHAIEVAWARGKIENLNKIFGFKIYSASDKPTNGEFISLISDKLMIQFRMGYYS